MRWRFVDRITAFEPWNLIEGRKVVSLEEYNLLEVLGHQGEFPQTLLLESFVQLTRWLVMKSSGFQEIGLLEEVSFTFNKPLGMGDELEMAVRVDRLTGSMLTVECRVLRPEGPACGGRLSLGRLALADFSDPENTWRLWRELYVQA